MKIEADVAAGIGILMDFNGNDVIAGLERVRIECKCKEGGFVGAAHGRGRQSLKRNRTGRHVVAQHFSAIQVNHSAIISQQAQRQILERRWISDIETAAEIIRDPFARGVAAARRDAAWDRCGFGVAIAE